jgi:hypothetical protein
LKPKQLNFIFASVISFFLCSSPGMAGTLFTDLGTGGSAYATSGPTWAVNGSGLGPSIQSHTAAGLFTVAGSGSNAVTQIDLALAWVGTGLNTFSAAIWTDNSGLPGTQVSGAYWSLTSNLEYGLCCSLVTIPGITGVSLTGGQQYFMVLGPISATSDLEWIWNSQGVTGLTLASLDGGSTWEFAFAGSTLGAFDVLGTATPEPGTMGMLGGGLLALGLLARFRYPT